MKNKYLKIYVKIIKKFQSSPSTDYYTEKHHIFPKCLFKNSKKVVKVSARVHYLLHFLLWKACKLRYGEKHKFTIKCFHSFWSMNIHLQHKRRFINSHLYEKCKIIKSEYMKKHNPMFDNIIKEKHKKSLKGINKGKNVSKETREKISNALKGIPFSDERKKNVSKGLRNTQRKKYSKWYTFFLPSGDQIIAFDTKNELSKKYNIPKTTFLRKVKEFI